MDPWSYSPDGRGVFFANEFEPSADSFARNRKFTPEWNQKPSNLMATDMFMSEFADRGLSDVILRPFHDSASPAKKSRAANSCSQSPSCQVLGCNIDLSSSKEYHRRHRVCEAHSKFPMVVVDGIEQRFCQQCSRFHVLTEFDERKRSCRRRLQGHNERRRKPSVYLVSGRGRAVFLPSKGTKFLETSLAKDLALHLPQTHHESLVYKVINEQNRRKSREAKFEDKYTYHPQTSIYPDLTISSSEVTVASASDWELQEASRSNCALSLLSAQSQHVSGTPSASFLLAEADGNKCPENDLATEGHTTRAIPTPTRKDLMESLFISWGKNGQVFSGSSSRLSIGTGSSTVDLLQLSSHLQRVERQRNSTQVSLGL